MSERESIRRGIRESALDSLPLKIAHKHYNEGLLSAKEYHSILKSSPQAEKFVQYYEINASNDLTLLQNEIGEWRDHQGFITKWSNFPEKLMLIVSELGEAMEGYRHLKSDFIEDLDKGIVHDREDLECIMEDSVDFDCEQIKCARSRLKQLGWYDNIKEELADVAIRLLDLCDGLDIDLVEEIHKKMGINEVRQPKHGKEC